MSLVDRSVEEARASEYALLATLLAVAPDSRTLAELSTIRGDESTLGIAHTALAEAAAATSSDQAQREFFELFIGVGRGELMPYASYYLTGFLNDRPLARLREQLARLGIERSEGNREPEDHAAVLCEIMAGFASNRFPASERTERELFEQHIAPWLGRFFTDLERAASADFYRRIGTVGRIFMEIESKAFSLS